jgi:hypothetical protein
MVRKSTYTKVIDFLNNVVNSKSTLKEYCKNNGNSKNYYTIWKSKINKILNDIPTDAHTVKLQDTILDLCDKVNFTNKDTALKEFPSPDSKEIVRDNNGIIVGYRFNIKRKVGGPLVGTLSRDEMDRLCSLFSRYGADLTLAQTALDFPQYSLDDISRIKRLFLIFKYSCPFAPHEVDEHTEEELHDLAIERKKNNLTRTLEKDQLRDAQKINLKLAKEVEELKNWQNNLKDIKVNISGLPTIHYEKPHLRQDTSFMLNLSDLHIGAKLSSDSLYNNDWNEKELVRRLKELILKIARIQGVYPSNTCYLNLLGDMLDGMDNMTARRDHVMPQNMDNKEQFNVFLKTMIWFIDNLSTMFNNIVVSSVPNGNHTGAPEYFAIVALKYAIDSKFKNVTMDIPDKFFTKIKVGNHLFLACHGKDATFMKKPLPLHLTNDAKVWLDNYLIREGVFNKNYNSIHILKGDLHTAGFDDTLQYDYRNCLSLFGDSDYSQMNYPSNGYGCSYAIIINNDIINGEFKNF